MTTMPRATAYLVGEFDIINEIPVLKNISAMSEFTPRGGVFYALFLKADGKDFEEATQNLYQSAASVPQWAWVQPWLERDRMAHMERMETTDYLRDQSIVLRKTRYEHDCDACCPLGRYNEYDLYYHPSAAQHSGSVSWEGSVIARHGKGGEYTSMPISGNTQLVCLTVAKRRASRFLEKGMINGNGWRSASNP